MIAMDDLRKQFTSGRGRQARTVVAVDGMTLHAQDGAITGLLGPNGAGKTTSLRMLVGLVTPDSGTHPRRRRRHARPIRKACARGWACCRTRAACTRA